jgi:hypothetical protein
VSARLLWGSRQRPVAILDDFCKAAFGAGAPAMRRFYDTLERYWTQPRKGRWFEGLGDMRTELAIANANWIKQAYACLQEAETISQGADRERVSYVKGKMRLPYIVVRALARAKVLAARPVASAADLDEIARDTAFLLRSIPQAHAEYATFWEHDPAYHPVYYGPEPVGGRLRYWSKEIEHAVEAAARKAYDYRHLRSVLDATGKPTK